MMIRMRWPLVLADLLLSAIAFGAQAGESVCWIQNGVLLVPALAAGVNGVFILDTGAAKSLLDATQASEADIDQAATVGEVRLAGRVIAGVRMGVVALDERTRDFPTPIAGVLGSDVLAGLVVEVEPEPCRLRLSSPGRAARPRAWTILPVELRAGVPYVRAGVSDGTRAAIGRFRVDTGSSLAVTFNASAARTTMGVAETLPQARLRALSIDDALLENVTAGVTQEADADGLGRIGEPVWARYRMRLDYARGTLALAPR
jgi:hypothetical protein